MTSLQALENQLIFARVLTQILLTASHFATTNLRNLENYLKNLDNPGEAKKCNKKENNNILTFLLARFILLKGKGQLQNYASYDHFRYLIEFQSSLRQAPSNSKSFDLANKLRRL